MVDLIPFLLVGLIMYWLIIKPQIDEKRTHDELVASLAKDDQVVTASGIHGKVFKVHDATIVLNIGDKTRITMDKTAVARRVEDTKA
jgi:preprotein translocase subunit YajC